MAATGPHSKPGSLRCPKGGRRPPWSSAKVGHWVTLVLVTISTACGLPLDDSGLPSSALAFYSSVSGSAPGTGRHPVHGQGSPSSYEEVTRATLPHNLTITLIKWYPLPAIRVSWTYDTSKDAACEAFRILYHPITSRYRYIVEVPCSVFNVTLDRLLPATEYVLTVNRFPLAVITDHLTTGHFKHQGYSLNTIRFISPQTEYNRFSKVRSTSLIIRKSPSDGEGQEIVVVKLGELLVVLFVLFLWFFVIGVFIRKWGKIRGIETTASLPVAVAALPIPGLNSTACSSVHHSIRAQRSKESNEESDKTIKNDSFGDRSWTGRRTSCFLLDVTYALEERRQAIERRKYKSAENLFVYT
ncbi:hypothetical protein HDE_03651 [Halotydeus destructor]|nr:hypothetical protein HDE_03651 [Halotydeus destructor]